MKQYKKIIVVISFVLLICGNIDVTAKAADVSIKKLSVGDSIVYDTSDYSRIKSTNSKIVEVTKQENQFIVTAKKTGTAKLRFYDSTGKLVRTENTIEINQSSFKYEDKPLVMFEGYLVKNPMNVSIHKDIRKKVTVSYKSENKKIAKYNKNGNFIGVKKGTTAVRATIKYQGKTVAVLKRKVEVKKHSSSKKDPLRGKSILGIGDSLMCGNVIGKKYTWLNMMGKENDMTVYNCGRNGTPLSQPKGSSVSSLSVQYKQIIRNVGKVNIVVIQGGANDKRYNVPIGKNSDKTVYTFKGALNKMISDTKKAFPDATIICMTNYDRFRSKNRIGKTDIDYVNAMKQVCKKRKVVCFDNYHDSGIDFHSKEEREWCDEGVYLGTSYNCHFSPEGYRYLLSIYEEYIRNICKQKP